MNTNITESEQKELNSRQLIDNNGIIYSKKDGHIVKPYIHHTGYAICTYNGKQECLHKVVMLLYGSKKPGKDYEIDHIDQNKLNNAISNLRWVTHQDNCYNRRTNLPAELQYRNMEHKEYMRIRMKEWRNKHERK